MAKPPTVAESVEQMVHVFFVLAVLNSPLTDSTSIECQHQVVEVAVIVVMKKLGRIITIVTNMR